MMRKKWIIVPVLAALLMGAAGCGGQAAGSSVPAPAPAAAESHVETVNKEEDMNIKITAGGHTIHAKLYDNAAAKKLWETLPKSYPMMNLYDREMCFRMGRGALPTSEAKDTGYRVGDISYWPPAGSLVILYSQNGEVFEQQPIGHTDDDISFFKGMPDTEIRFEKE